MITHVDSTFYNQYEAKLLSVLVAVHNNTVGSPGLYWSSRLELEMAVCVWFGVWSNIGVVCLLSKS